MATTTSPTLLAAPGATQRYHKCLSYGKATTAFKRFCIESTNRVESVLKHEPKSFYEPSKGPKVPALLYGGGRPNDDPGFVSDVSWKTTSEGKKVFVYVGGFADPAGNAPNVPAVLVYASPTDQQLLRAPTAPDHLLYLVRISVNKMLLSSSETTGGELTQPKKPTVDIIFNTSTRTFSRP